MRMMTHKSKVLNWVFFSISSFAICGTAVAVSTDHKVVIEVVSEDPKQ